MHKFCKTRGISEYSYFYRNMQGKQGREKCYFALFRKNCDFHLKSPRKCENHRISLYLMKILCFRTDAKTLYKRNDLEPLLEVIFAKTLKYLNFPKVSNFRSISRIFAISAFLGFGAKKVGTPIPRPAPATRAPPGGENVAPATQLKGGGGMG